MTIKDFADGLLEMGYENVVVEGNAIKLDYKIITGNYSGRVIRMAFEVGNDFPLNPPGGLHISPRLLEIHPQKDLPHPKGAVHPSRFGSDWEYLSRRFKDWGQAEKTVRAYMRFVHHLFEDI